MAGSVAGNLIFSSYFLIVSVVPALEGLLCSSEIKESSLLYVVCLFIKQVSHTEQVDKWAMKEDQNKKVIEGRLMEETNKRDSYIGIVGKEIE